VGNPGTPLLDVAKYLATSLICDEPSPLACNSCITCLRVNSDNYPDFIVFDGSKDSIKKEDIMNIESQFEKKAFEAKGIRIYILHLVDNMTDQALNALLKFLEEPDSNVYAFLTTNNEGNVLPTIVSRCQSLYLKALSRDYVITNAINMGVKKDDAEFLSFFYNEPSLIEELTRNEDKFNEYLTAKNGIIALLNALTTNKKEVIYTMQKDILPLIKNKESLRFFIDMLAQVYEDIIALKVGKKIYLEEQKELFNSIIETINNANEVLIEILKVRNNISLNINTGLILDHLAFTITREAK
jgi:DNA polymerase-3 subunit delta'